MDDVIEKQSILYGNINNFNTLNTLKMGLFNNCVHTSRPRWTPVSPPPPPPRGLKPIFHCKLCGQRENFVLGIQRNLYSIGSRWGFALGVTQILYFALGVTQILAFLDTNMLVSNGKLWRWGCKPTQGPNVNGFALQWNIGFIVQRTTELATQIPRNLHFLAINHVPN